MFLPFSWCYTCWKSDNVFFLQSRWNNFSHECIKQQKLHWSLFLSRVVLKPVCQQTFHETLLLFVLVWFLWRWAHQLCSLHQHHVLPSSSLGGSDLNPPDVPLFVVSRAARRDTGTLHDCDYVQFPLWGFVQQLSRYACFGYHGETLFISAPETENLPHVSCFGSKWSLKWCWGVSWIFWNRFWSLVVSWKLHSGCVTCQTLNTTQHYLTACFTGLMGREHLITGSSRCFNSMHFVIYCIFTF